MRTAHFIFVTLLTGCVAFDGNFGKYLQDIINALKKISNLSKSELKAVKSDPVYSGSRGLTDHIGLVVQALDKVDGLVSTLENGAKALPMLRSFLKTGQDTLNIVAKAQKELPTFGPNTSGLQSLSGGLGFAKKMISSVMGIFKPKVDGTGGFADNLRGFGDKINSQMPGGLFGSVPATAQAISGSSVYSPSSSMYSPSSSLYNPSSSMYSPSSSLYNPSSSVYSPSKSSYSSGSSMGSLMNSPSTVYSPSLSANGLGSSGASGFAKSQASSWNSPSSIYSPSSSYGKASASGTAYASRKLKYVSKP